MFKKVFFIGIGGVSMSGLARVLLAMGVQVAGSDMEENDEILRLRKEGINVTIGHKATVIDGDLDLVVVTDAVPEDNVEVSAAQEKRIPVWRRSQLIGKLMADKIAIAVAGMHGKSTVSAMLATLLTEMDEDPTVLVGADVKSIGANAKLGKSDLMVVEACEYKRAFLDFEPTIAVLTNIEEEHLDIYKDLADIIETFGMFVAKLPKDGLLAAYIDDLNVRKVLGRTKACVVGYGFGRKPEEFKGVYWHIKNVEQNGHHKKFAIDVEGEDIGVFEIKLPGNFNILNVVATLIVADFLCLDMEKAGQVLANFAGAGRRFEILGEKDGVLVIDDYGHHPTEIKNVLAAIKEFYPSNDLWVVFQAHQYSRTHHLLADFATSFGNAQKLILIDIYRVRDSEEDVKKVNADILGERISAESKVEVVRVADYQEAADYLQKNCKKGIIVLTLGAGPVNKVASLFLNK